MTLELGGRLLTVATDLAREGIAESDFRLATNTGPDANQTVFHFHLHCRGGRKLGHEG
jgi:histidine triad (HIT) family protein